MQQGNVSEMAAKFTAAYLALKEKKDVEKLITVIKPMILSAKADGITDKELIEIINDLGLREKFYPAKLKDLRKKLFTPDQEEPAIDGEVQPSPGPSEPTEAFSAAFNGLSGGEPFK